MGDSVEQGHLLHALGITARASALSARATPAQQADIQSALTRLTAPNSMGRLFRAIAITHPAAPVPAGFARSTGDSA